MTQTVITTPELQVSDVLSPSEAVFLNGEQFASEGSWLQTETDLLHTDQTVSAQGLSDVVLSVAILANEQAGALRLVPGQKKGWFGLRTRRVLFVEAGDRTPEWPAGSLEALVQESAASLLARGNPVTGEDLVYHLLGADSQNPYLETFDDLSAGLAGRDLLETSETRVLRIFTTTRYDLPESTALLAREADLAAVRDLLAETETDRPEVWARLHGGIAKAVGARTESDDDWDDDMDWD